MTAQLTTSETPHAAQKLLTQWPWSPVGGPSKQNTQSIEARVLQQEQWEAIPVDGWPIL